MNYQNIENEIKQYSEYFKLNQSILSKLSNYYKETGKQGIQFAIKIKKHLDDIYIEILKQDRNTTYNKFLISFYNEKKNFIEKLKTFFVNIEKNLGDKIAEYEKNYKNKCKDILVNFNILNKNLFENKSQLDKWKNQYFTLCKNSSDYEKKIISFQNQPDKEENLIKFKMQYMRNEELKNLKKKNYNQEQIKLNKLLESSELNYKNIIDLIEKENVEKMKYVGNIIKDSNQNFLTFTQNFIEHLKKIEELKTALNAKRDWKDIKKTYNFSYDQGINKDKRFLLEEFLDYDSMKNNQDLNNINSINTNSQQGNNNVIGNEENDEKLIRAKRIYNIGKLFFINLNNLNEKEKEIDKIIINLISGTDTIKNEDFLKAIQYIENEENNCITFMDILATHFCDVQFISVKNYDNFYNLINIIIVILNSAFDKKEIFDVCFLIIFIAEKCGYLGNAQSPTPTFFFEVLSSKSIFSSPNFWKDLIETKIEIFSQLDINKEYNKRMKNIINKNKIFGNIFGKNNDIESELMLKQIFKEKAIVYFSEIFYSFLKHFTHFNFYKQEEILNFFYNKYKIEENILDYFKEVIKSDNIFNKQKKLITMIKLRDKNNQNKILFNYTPRKDFKQIENKKIKCILFSLKYLNKSDYISILCLSKKYYKSIQHIIYKQILLKQKNIEIKVHIKIWNILLNINELKNKYNYQKISEFIKDKNNKITNENIIILDIDRTHISKNKEENKFKLLNVLKAISYAFPNISYYQGMNQIGAFLLNICDYNEEEAFYLFAGIIKNTKYCSIYDNNLEKIKNLFYQFDRILNLYIPEIYIYFNQNSVNSGCFVSPWFITLFTNFFNDTEGKNNAKTIMLILDLFIFSGWKTFMKIGIILFKSKEKEILENDCEILLPFLTGDIIKSEIIEEKNLEKLREELKDIRHKIKNELFENIEKEFEIKKNIEFFKEGNKINSAF